jgi:hypothetical protein
VIGPIVILLRIGRQLGACTRAVAGSTRLRMVAGWDQLLPQWFSRPPVTKTPVNSILFVAALILLAAGLAGAGQQEAFQILGNSSGIFYSFTYLVMFALPVVGLRNNSSGNGSCRPPGWLRGAALSGLGDPALLRFPIIQVASPLAFSAKLGGVIAGANLGCASLYWWARRSSTGKDI